VYSWPTFHCQQVLLTKYRMVNNTYLCLLIKFQIFLSHLNSISILIDFHGKSQYQMSPNSVHWEPRWHMPTDGHKAKRRFSRPWKCAQQPLQFTEAFQYVNIIYINNNQHDALFILSLLSYHTSTSFGCISSPSSGGRMDICGKWYLLYCWVDCQRAWPDDSKSVITQ
jgi:hypothetical protein